MTDDRTTAGATGSPFFFGDSGLLLGIYHPPSSRIDRETGVVICNPFGREYLYAHRTLRHAALRLAERGFHTLRFDYYGAGDSAGDAEEASLQRWTGDVGAAVEELETRAGLARVALLGLRLGASLAWLAAATRRDVDALVLWEPVTSGRQYLEEMIAQDRSWRADRHIPREGPPGADVLGFPIPEVLRGEFEELILPADPESQPVRQLLLLLHTSPTPEDAFARSLSEGPRSEVACLPTRPFWQPGGEGPAAVVPGPSVQRVVEWLDRTLS
jgi:pimeloyl-ACP methyl ester carboxylesterase